MSDALLSAALKGLESNHCAPALLWLTANFASGSSADADHVCRRLAALLARRGETTDHLVGPSASWSDLARRHHIPECLLRALNTDAPSAQPAEGQSIRVVCGEHRATIAKAKRTLQLHWKSELAAEFTVFGIDSLAIPAGTQEIRQKRIDPVYYDPKMSHLPREPHGLRFNRHILQFASGLKIHGVPDWDANTQGIGLSASDAAIVYAALAIGSHVEIEVGDIELPQQKPQASAVDLSAHVVHVQFDGNACRPVRVTAAGFHPIGGGFDFAFPTVGKASARGCGQLAIGSTCDGDNTCTSSFTTAELTAISWPIEVAATLPPTPAQDPHLFPLDQQGAAWPPPTGWQLLQLGLTLTAVVFLGLFVFKNVSGPKEVATNRPMTVPTRHANPPKPIAVSIASPVAKTDKPGAPPLLAAPKSPQPAAASPVVPPASPRVEAALFVEKQNPNEALPPVVVPDQAPRVTMEVLVPDQAVPLGSRAIYEIRLKNQSLAPVEGIDVQAFFSDGYHPDAADGAPARHGPGILQFDRIGRLNSGESITLRIAARAQAAGAYRIRPEVSVANPPQKLHSEVTTRYYAPLSTNPVANPPR